MDASRLRDLNPSIAAHDRDLKTKLQNTADPDELADLILEYYPALKLNIAGASRRAFGRAKADSSRRRKIASDLRRAYSQASIKNSETKQLIIFAEKLERQA